MRRPQNMAISSSPQKALTDRLIAALQQDEFVLYAQSITPLGQKDPARPFQEIFIRFKEEDAKLLPPGSFFPILEECHLLPYLDRWVVNRLMRWIDNGERVSPNWHIPHNTVNLSSATLVDPNFGKFVLHNVSESRLSDGTLAFEIGWDAAMEHQEALQRLVAELGTHGCWFTLTGFDGTEPAFARLKTLAPNFVKICPSIIGNLDSLVANEAKVAEINRRCHMLGAKTIAEQVESRDMLEQLRKTQIDFAQGYEISPVQPL